MPPQYLAVYEICALICAVGTEQEIFTVDELSTKFSLDRITKSPAVFDKVGWARMCDLIHLAWDCNEFAYAQCGLACLSTSGFWMLLR